jgi:hypothetical protein
LPSFRQGGSLHVLVITGSGIGLISGDVKDGALRNREILVIDGVTGTDLGTLGVKGNGERTASLDTGSLARVVNDRLVVLQISQRESAFDVGSKELTSYEPWEKFMRTTLRPTMAESVYHLKTIFQKPIVIPVRRALIFSAEFVLGPNRLSVTGIFFVTFTSLACNVWAAYQWYK